MNQPGSDERHLELKVGAVILVALALLVTFVLVLGDWSFATRKTVEIYFQNPGGLLPNASVKVAGRKVGVITEMSFLGQSGPEHPTTRRPALVRARIELDEDVVDALRGDARFYITTKGVLGDPFLEIDPGFAPDRLDLERPVFGIDPPRLDLFLADAAELVNGLNGLLERNAEHLDQLLSGGAHLVGAVESLVDGGMPVGRFEQITTNLDGLLVETRELVNGAQRQYIDNPKIARTVNNLEALSGKLNREIGPLITEIRHSLEAIEKLSDAIGPEERASLKSALGRMDNIAKRTDAVIAKVDTIVDRIHRGEGTVGQLAADEEIYDDLKELIRDIKRHPWKLIWQD